MSYLVGVILLVVFLGFAVAMFLERISALLALPLMAVVFVLIAAVADLRTPAPVAVTAATNGALPRFEAWTRVRHAQARILHDKAVRLVEAGQALAADLDDPPDVAVGRLRAAVSRISEEEEAFARGAYAELDAFPTFFARPPHYGGARARFDEAFDALAIAPRLKSISAVLDGHPPAETLPRIRAVLSRWQGESARCASRHPPPPDAASPGFRFSSGLTYLANYVVLTLRAGSLHLYAAIIATIFGGMFAVYVKNLKVAERMVYWTAEFAGERPLVIALAIFLVTAGIFTSVGGLGTVIMLGTIILPILRSVGLGPIGAAGVFLIGISMGGTLHPVARRLWIEYYGIEAGQLDRILWTMVGLYAAGGVAWVWWSTRRALLSSFSFSRRVGTAHLDRTPAPTGGQCPPYGVPARLMVAPLIPVLLVYFAGMEEITSFTAAIAYMYACTCRRRGAVRMLARSLIEGAQIVMPPALLMVGIGILVVSLSSAPVQAYLRPLLSAVVPHTRLSYIGVFALAAPLALYRGPLNVWGMGLAVSATLLSASSLPPAAILCAILAAGMLQGVCDPTNTANVWIAGFQGVTVNQILRRTLLLMWALAVVAVVVFGVWFVET